MLLRGDVLWFSRSWRICFVGKHCGFRFEFVLIGRLQGMMRKRVLGGTCRVLELEFDGLLSGRPSSTHHPQTNDPRLPNFRNSPTLLSRPLSGFHIKATHLRLLRRDYFGSTCVTPVAEWRLERHHLQLDISSWEEALINTQMSSQPLLQTHPGTSSSNLTKALESPSQSA
jgi:hypothetical protein